MFLREVAEALEIRSCSITGAEDCENPDMGIKHKTTAITPMNALGRFIFSSTRKLVDKHRMGTTANSVSSCDP